MSSHFYIVGGESKEDQIRCREGFRKLIEKIGFLDSDRGFAGKMPKLSSCGGRNAAFEDFKLAHSKSRKGDFIALLIDSEDPIAEVDTTWDHLKVRDGWQKPASATNEQVLFMTTCMETWIIADRETLNVHYGHKLQTSALPALNQLESRNRHEIYEKLTHATRHCSNAYKKGKRSFEVLGLLNPSALNSLPSFVRIVKILRQNLS